MVIGRVLGWLMIGLAVIMASADAVMALGPAEHPGIVTADVVTLLSGRSPETLSGLWAPSRMAELMRNLPAWVLAGALGTCITLVFRKRHRRFRFRTR